MDKFHFRTGDDAEMSFLTELFGLFCHWLSV